MTGGQRTVPGAGAELPERTGVPGEQPPQCAPATTNVPGCTVPVARLASPQIMGDVSRKQNSPTFGISKLSVASQDAWGSLQVM